MPDRLRTAAPADLPQLLALERACFGPADGGFSPRQLRALLRNPHAHWLLAADGGAMACWLRVSNGRARWARLYSLAVHPALRGRGLAGRLLEAGFAWMAAHDLSICRAEVKAENRAARALYASFGFREASLLANYYGEGHDGVRLIRDLDAPAAQAAPPPGACRPARTASAA